MTSCPSYSASNDRCDDDDSKDHTKEDPERLPSHTAYPVIFRFWFCNKVVDQCWFLTETKRHAHRCRRRRLKTLQLLQLGTARQGLVRVKPSFFSHIDLQPFVVAALNRRL